MLPTLVRLERGTLSFTKYIQITAQATRQALKDDERVKAERRTAMGLRYQKWEDGKPGEQTWVREQTEEEKAAH